ncbi:MAG: cell division protein ZapB [Thermodesulfobacteriota bacterium]
MSEFEKLEERVNRLLKDYEDLREASTGAKKLVRLKDLEIEGLEKKLKQLDQERGKVRGRVDALLARLDNLIQ